MDEFKQRISVHPDHILVERPDDYRVVLSEQRASLVEIAQACQEDGLQKVLIVGPRTEVRLSVMDVYNLGKEIAELGILQIAVVESHDAASEDVTLLEDVASNRGALFQFFGTREAAEQWLGIAEPTSAGS